MEQIFKKKNTFSLFLIDGERRILKTKKYGQGWDGSYKEEQVPLGVYIYRVNYVEDGNREKIIRGGLTNK